jgi:hypothetical protein
LPHPNGGGFLGQPAAPCQGKCEGCDYLIQKTIAEPKTKLKKIGSTAPVEEEEKAEAEGEAEPRSEEEEENLGKALPKDISDTHLLPFPCQMKKHAEDEKFSSFVEVIQGMYIHILMLDTMHVLTYARYLKDILNQKRPIPETDRLVFAERCSAAILDGLLNEMGDSGVPTISCLIGT